MNNKNNNKHVPAKRVQMVSLRLVKEDSTLYAGRKITSPEDVIRLINDFKQDFELLDRECFYAIHCNVKLEPTVVEEVSRGLTASTLVSSKEVMRTALLSQSSNVFYLHNHPSGSAVPSLQDHKVYQSLKESGEYFNINTVDFLIVGDGEYYSFKEEDEL